MTDKIEHEITQITMTEVEPPPSNRRLVWVVGCLVGIVLLLVFLPTIAGMTSLRNVVLNRVLKHPQLDASTESATFGWYAPLELQNLQISDDRKHVNVHIDRVTAERSAMSLWWDPRQVGAISLDKPTIDIMLPLSLEGFPKSETNPTFQTDVNDARLIVRAESFDEPMIDLQDLDLSIAVKPREKGRELVVEPVQIFDRHRLTPELCDQGLQLIAPILANAADVEGKVSLELSKLQFPLDVSTEEAAKLSNISGQVQLHQVNATLNNPLLQKIIVMVEKSMKVKIPERIQIADESQVNFRIEDGRVHHDSLAFFFPDVSDDLVIKTAGSVGIDRTLDLTIDVPLALPIPGLPKKVIKFQVAGTLDTPKFGLPKKGFLADRTGAGDGEDRTDVEQLLELGVGVGLELLKNRRERMEERQGEDPNPRGGLFRRRRNSDEDQGDETERGESLRGKILKELLKRGLESSDN